LIVTSATVDAVSMRDFFNFKKLKTEEDTSVILGAKGKLYPVTIHYTIGNFQIIVCIQHHL